jgi:hypothetical protein
MESPSYLPPAAKVDKLHFKECLIELLQVLHVLLPVGPLITLSQMMVERHFPVRFLLYVFCVVGKILSKIGT